MGFRKRLAGLKGERGFTLLELVVVIAVIAILAALVIPRVGQAMEDARKGSANLAARELRVALERFFKDKGYYAADNNVADNVTVTERVYDYATLRTVLSPYISLPTTDADAVFTFRSYDDGSAATAARPTTFTLVIRDTTAAQRHISITPDGIDFNAGSGP